MKCKICSEESSKIFSHLVLAKYLVQYYRCSHCEYVFTEEPYWLKEAYESVINPLDTGMLDRNVHLSRLVSVLLYFCLDPEAVYLDYAGGCGVFTRLMRDIGFDFYWHDPYCPNLFARGFEFDGQPAKKAALLTSFESFEHFVFPMDEIEKMFGYSDQILFSTVVISQPVPKPEDWWYYGFEHGQHISFYTFKTFDVIAQKFDCQFYEFGPYYLFVKRKFSQGVLRYLHGYSRVLSWYVRKKMIRKTHSDHLMLKGRKFP